MARRIDIELTSARPDGSWTWRAAGAMQPRGVVDGKLLPDGTKAGDVVKADADFEIEGIVINSVLVPKEKKRSEPARIELIAPSAPVTGVTTQLVGRTDRGSSDRRRPRSDDGRPGERGRGGPDRARRDRPERPDRASQPDRGDQSDRAQSSPRPDSSAASNQVGASAGTGRGRPAERGRPPAPGGSRPNEGGRPAAGSGPRHDDRNARRTTRPDTGDRVRPRRDGSASVSTDGAERGNRSTARRLNPSNTHRQAVMASLPPEQQPIAEQVLRGGIPAVRTAIHLEREKATAEGRAAPNTEALLALAEGLRPRLREAEWRDRAEAAVKVADSVALRDLRSVVTGADLARSEESRQLAVTLRETLERRLTAQHDEWATDIAHQLDEGRVVRALRAAARAPEATSRLSPEQATRLSDAAGAAMSPDAAPDLWAALLEAVAASPVRRTVTPAGLPAEPGPALLSAAQQQAGRIPALAALLGITIPPPPGPTRAPAAGRPAQPHRNRPQRPPRPRTPASEPRVEGSSGPGSAPPVAADAPAPADPAAEAPAPADTPAPAPAPADTTAEAPTPPISAGASAGDPAAYEPLPETPAVEVTPPPAEANATPAEANATPAEASEPPAEPSAAPAEADATPDQPSETPSPDEVDATH